MRMLATCIDVEVAEEISSQSVLRKHTADCVLQNTLGMDGANLGRGGLTLAAGIAGVALIYLS